MRRIKLMTGALLGVLLISCSDDLVERNFERPQSGEDIVFGTQLQDFTRPQSRTIYGVPDGESVEDYSQLTIDWVEGDQVRVYCPEASTECQWADYDVKSVLEDGVSKYYLEKQGEIGVRWGDTENDVHNFYAFYPLNIGRNNPVKISGLEGNMTVSATIPVAQEHGDLVEAGNQATDVGNVTLPANWKLFRPDMTYAMMAGTGTWDPNTATEKNVTLNFTPLVSVVDVVINGPASGQPAMNIYTVSIRSKNQPIVGPFTYDFSTNSFSGMEDNVQEGDNNIATISCIHEVGGVASPVTLNAGEVLTLKFFLLPRDIQASELSVSVLTDAGRVLTQNLVPEGGAQQDRPLVQGKITRVITPKMTMPDASNWMSLINDNVLFTQLSLPGSKHSYTGDLYTEDASNVDADRAWMDFYQSLYVTDTNQQGESTTQFDQGIRAFDIKLIEDGSNMCVYVGNKKLQNSNYPDGMTIGNVLNNLYDKLRESPTEGVVLCINYVNSGAIYAYQWLNQVVARVNDWGNLHNNVLTQITPQTTMLDMRGKIAVIINLTNDMSAPGGSNVNYITGFTSAVNNTTIQNMRMNGQFQVHMQNLYQVNNPLITEEEGSWGVYPTVGLVPYYATEPDFTLGHDLLAVKKDLMNDLFDEARTDQNCLYINDLSGFSVVKHSQSTGFRYATVSEWTEGGWFVSDRWDTHYNEEFYDYNKIPTTDQPANPAYGDQYLVSLGEEHSYWGQGGNTAAFAEEFNPVAVNAVNNMVNNGRVPLGLVFQNFVGVSNVTAGDDHRNYNVYGLRLPGLVMANNFMFTLETRDSN